MKIIRRITIIASLLLIIIGVVTCNKSEKGMIGSPIKQIKVKEFRGIITNKENYRNLLSNDCLIKLNNGETDELYGDDRIKFNVGDTMFQYSYKQVGGYKKSEIGIILSRISLTTWLLGIISFIIFSASYNYE